MNFSFSNSSSRCEKNSRKISRGRKEEANLRRQRRTRISARRRESGAGRWSQASRCFENLNIIRTVTSSWNKCGKISTCCRDSWKSRRQSVSVFPQGFYKSSSLPLPLFSSVLRDGHCFFERGERERFPVGEISSFSKTNWVDNRSRNYAFCFL